MSYWDTSTLVKLYAQEPNSGAFENYALSTLPGVKRFAGWFSKWVKAADRESLLTSSPTVLNVAW